MVKKKKILNLVDNLTSKVNACIDYKSCFGFMNVKDGLLIFDFSESSKNHKKMFDKDLAKEFKNKYKFCDRDINKFCLMLRKVVYAYKHIDSWKKFSETKLLTKE